MNSTLVIHQRTAFCIKELYNTFKFETYELLSDRAIDELVRQCFDNLDMSYQLFSIYINTPPNFSVVPDMQHILQTDYIKIINAAKSFYNGIYLLTVQMGLRIKNRFPFLLEQISYGTCILYYDCSLNCEDIIIVK